MEQSSFKDFINTVSESLSELSLLNDRGSDGEQNSVEAIQGILRSNLGALKTDLKKDYMRDVKDILKLNVGGNFRESNSRYHLRSHQRIHDKDQQFVISEDDRRYL